MKTTLVLSILLAVMSGPTHSTLVPKAPIAPNNPVIIEGIITDWVIEADGDVLYRVAPPDDLKGGLWFVSPPSRGATTQVEQLLLLGVMEASKERTLVEAKGDGNATGTSGVRKRPLTTMSFRARVKKW